MNSKVLETITKEVTWEEAFELCYSKGAFISSSTKENYASATRTLRYKIDTMIPVKFNIVITPKKEESKVFLSLVAISNKVDFFISNNSVSISEGAHSKITLGTDNIDITLTVTTIVVNGNYSFTSDQSVEVNFITNIDGVIFDRDHLEFYTSNPSQTSFVGPVGPPKGVDDEQLEPPDFFSTFKMFLTSKNIGEETQFPYFDKFLSYNFIKFGDISSLMAKFETEKGKTVIGKSDENKLEDCLKEPYYNKMPEFITWIYLNDSIDKGVCLITTCNGTQTYSSFVQDVYQDFINYVEAWKLNVDYQQSSIRLAVLKKSIKHGKHFDKAKLGIELTKLPQQQYVINASRPLPIHSIVIRKSESITSAELDGNNLLKEDAFRFTKDKRQRIYMPINMVQYKGPIILNMQNSVELDQWAVSLLKSWKPEQLVPYEPEVVKFSGVQCQHKRELGSSASKVFLFRGQSTAANDSRPIFYMRKPFYSLENSTHIHDIKFLNDKKGMITFQFWSTSTPITLTIRTEDNRSFKITDILIDSFWQIEQFWNLVQLILKPNELLLYVNDRLVQNKAISLNDHFKLLVTTSKMVNLDIFNLQPLSYQPETLNGDLRTLFTFLVK